MSTTIWSGTVTAGQLGAAVTFSTDPATGEITSVRVDGAVAFTAAEGYPELTGQFTSEVTLGSPAVDVPTAWAAAESQVLILAPGTTYQMTLTTTG